MLNTAPRLNAVTALRRAFRSARNTSLLSASMLSVAMLSVLCACASDDGASKKGTSTTAADQTAEKQEASVDAELATGHQKDPRPDAVLPVAGEISVLAKSVLEAADRTEEDRGKDAHRHGAETLTFIGAKPGWRVADLGAGSGYTTELLARAIGADGKLWMHNDPSAIERFFKKELATRLERDAMQGVVRVDRSPQDPLPEEAKDLDAITAIFTYHDIVVAGVDRAQLNALVFARLKPGGVYVIADHSAPAGAGTEAASKLHRLEESIVRAEVEAAGFVLDAEGQFLRDPYDTLVGVSYKQGFKCDRYLLRFRKPAD